MYYVNCTIPILYYCVSSNLSKKITAVTTNLRGICALVLKILQTTIKVLQVSKSYIVFHQFKSFPYCLTSSFLNFSNLNPAPIRPKSNQIMSKQNWDLKFPKNYKFILFSSLIIVFSIVI